MLKAGSGLGTRLSLSIESGFLRVPKSFEAWAIICLSISRSIRPFLLHSWCIIWTAFSQVCTLSRYQHPLSPSVFQTYHSVTIHEYMLKSTGAIQHPWRRPLLISIGSSMAFNRTCACTLLWNDAITSIILIHPASLELSKVLHVEQSRRPLQISKHQERLRSMLPWLFNQLSHDEEHVWPSTTLLKPHWDFGISCFAELCIFLSYNSCNQLFTNIVQ